MSKRDTFTTTQETWNGYAVKDLRETFAAISNPADPKGPVDCTVHVEELAATLEAIRFMTATDPGRTTP